MELVFREIVEKNELLALFKLRHLIYFEKCKYGDIVPSGLDISGFDRFARFYGVFNEQNELIAGVRFVSRFLSLNFSLVDEIISENRAKIDKISIGLLPSEPVFSGLVEHKAEVELGRFVSLPGKNVGPKMLICILGALQCLKIEKYIYSCGLAAGARYAKFMCPYWTTSETLEGQSGLAGFDFPIKSMAAACLTSQTKHFLAASQAAASLKNSGKIDLESVIIGGIDHG